MPRPVFSAFEEIADSINYLLEESFDCIDYLLEEVIAVISFSAFAIPLCALD